MHLQWSLDVYVHPDPGRAAAGSLETTGARGAAGWASFRAQTRWKQDWKLVA